MNNFNIKKFVPTDEQPFIPSHKQYSLFQHLTVEQISAKLGFEPHLGSKDGKCDHTWSFTAESLHGVPVECEIWDYKGSRWSAYGSRQLFEYLGFLNPTSFEPEFTREELVARLRAALTK